MLHHGLHQRAEMSVPMRPQPAILLFPVRAEHGCEVGLSVRLRSLLGFQLIEREFDRE